MLYWFCLISDLEIFSLARYIPNIVRTAKVICITFKISLNKKIARIDAVSGCINNPIEPTDAGIFPIPYVMKYCPPSWHNIANEKRLIHSIDEEGIKLPPCINIGIAENKQQNKVV